MRTQGRAATSLAGGSPGTPAIREAAAPAARTGRRAGIRYPLCARALLLWPGLDRTRLARTHGDPRKVARLVARRTIHSEDVILSLLEGA